MSEISLVIPTLAKLGERGNQTLKAAFVDADHDGTDTSKIEWL